MNACLNIVMAWHLPQWIRIYKCTVMEKKQNNKWVCQHLRFSSKQTNAFNLGKRVGPLNSSIKLWTVRWHIPVPKHECLSLCACIWSVCVVLKDNRKLHSGITSSRTRYWRCLGLQDNKGAISSELCCGHDILPKAWWTRAWMSAVHSPVGVHRKERVRSGQF